MNKFYESIGLYCDGMGWRSGGRAAISGEARLWADLVAKWQWADHWEELTFDDSHESIDNSFFANIVSHTKCNNW